MDVRGLEGSAPGRGPPSWPRGTLSLHSALMLFTAGIEGYTYPMLRDIFRLRDHVSYSIWMCPQIAPGGESVKRKAAANEMSVSRET